MVLRFAPAMTGMGKPIGRREIDWQAEADEVILQARGHDFARMQRGEQRASTFGLIIATTLLCTIFAAATLFGGHAIGPLLRHAAAVRDAKGIGALVYTMPDGVFCRRMSFDNATGALGPTQIERCSQVAEKERGGMATKYKWGRR